MIPAREEWDVETLARGPGELSLEDCIGATDAHELHERVHPTELERAGVRLVAGDLHPGRLDMLLLALVAADIQPDPVGDPQGREALTWNTNPVSRVPRELQGAHIRSVASSAFRHAAPLLHVLAHVAGAENDASSRELDEPHEMLKHRLARKRPVHVVEDYLANRLQPVYDVEVWCRRRHTRHAIIAALLKHLAHRLDDGGEGDPLHDVGGIVLRITAVVLQHEAVRLSRLLVRVLLVAATIDREGVNPAHVDVGGLNAVIDVHLPAAFRQRLGPCRVGNYVPAILLLVILAAPLVDLVASTSPVRSSIIGGPLHQLRHHLCTRPCRTLGHLRLDEEG
mmetsp:Transcript_26501/g.68380  ORF Transcript_26501/g.68380 Transcript_26501/m.68380 type:complete len:339 (-) Transcript_26501:194-1210(-)